MGPNTFKIVIAFGLNRLRNSYRIMVSPSLSRKDRSGDGCCRSLFAALAENKANVSGLSCDEPSQRGEKALPNYRANFLSPSVKFNFQITTKPSRPNLPEIVGWACSYLLFSLFPD